MKRALEKVHVAAFDELRAITPRWKAVCMISERDPDDLRPHLQFPIPPLYRLRLGPERRWSDAESLGVARFCFGVLLSGPVLCVSDLGRGRAPFAVFNLLQFVGLDRARALEVLSRELPDMAIPDALFVPGRELAPVRISAAGLTFKEYCRHCERAGLSRDDIEPGFERDRSR